MRLGRNDLNLVGEILAQGKSGPANGAEHVTTVGELADAHLLAKTDIP